MNANQIMKLFLAIRKAIDDQIDAYPDGLSADVLFATLEMVTAQLIRTVAPSDNEIAMYLVKQFGEHLAELLPDAPVFRNAKVVPIKRHEND